MGEILKCGHSDEFSRLCFDPEIERFTVFPLVFFSSDQWPAGAKNVSDNGNRFIHAKVGRPVIDPYYAAAILDLKRGWTGISNTHAIFRMHNLF